MPAIFSEICTHTHKHTHIHTHDVGEARRERIIENNDVGMCCCNMSSQRQLLTELQFLKLFQSFLPGSVYIRTGTGTVRVKEKFVQHSPCMGAENGTSSLIILLLRFRSFRVN